MEPAEEQIRMVFRGALEAGVVKEATAVLEAETKSRSQRSFTVVMDLREVDGCDIFARSELANLQRHLAGCACRTAYIASRSRFRGLALWVIHLAEDPRAKSVMSEEAMEAWLSSSDERVSTLRERTTQLADRLQKRGA